MTTPINQLPIEDIQNNDDELIMKEILSVQAEAAREIAMEQQQAPKQIVQTDVKETLDNTLLRILKGDAKLIGLIFLAVIIVEFMPINAIISKYIALEKIPYHDILLKAAVVTIIVVFGQHFLNV